VNHFPTDSIVLKLETDRGILKYLWVKLILLTFIFLSVSNYWGEYFLVFVKSQAMYLFWGFFMIMISRIGPLICKFCKSGFQKFAVEVLKCDSFIALVLTHIY